MAIYFGNSSTTLNISISNMLDYIKAEIENEMVLLEDGETYISVDKVFEIIDKYRREG